MMPAVVREYLIAAMSGTPEVAERLLRDLQADDPRWDFRPDAARFTLREVVAHLADWEPIHIERITRMQEEVNPTLADIDEGKMAVENDYAHSDPHGSLEWLRGGRQKLVRQLGALTPEEWTRPGYRESIGPVSIEILAAFIAAHDGYHTRQIVQWLALAEADKQAE
jgi:uncharacterized damage-inducible protein DinB